MSEAEIPRYHVGSYAEAGGGGLYPLLRGSESEWRIGAPDPAAQDASYGVYSPRFGIHTFVEEGSEGAIGAYAFEDSGWRCLGRTASRGAEPCYLALHPAQAWLAVANYGSGSIALFRLDPQSGVPQAPGLFRQNLGSGPTAERQEGPHAHCAIFSPDGRWLFHVDLGADEVLAYPFDAERGELGERRLAWKAPPGSGPRHLVFHPSEALALLVSELAAELTLFDLGEGELIPRQSMPSLPEGAGSDNNLGGHLALNAAGTRAYVTNRGHDSLSVFALEDGRLHLLQNLPTGGASPRFFLLDEEAAQLVLAHEQGCSVALFDIAEDGQLTGPSSVLPVPGAAFVTRTFAEPASPGFRD